MVLTTSASAGLHQHRPVTYDIVEARYYIELGVLVGSIDEEDHSTENNNQHQHDDYQKGSAFLGHFRLVLASGAEVVEAVAASRTHEYWSTLRPGFDLESTRAAASLTLDAAAVIGFEVFCCALVATGV